MFFRFSSGIFRLAPPTAEKKFEAFDGCTVSIYTIVYDRKCHTQRGERDAAASCLHEYKKRVFFFPPADEKKLLFFCCGQKHAGICFTFSVCRMSIFVKNQDGNRRESAWDSVRSPEKNA